MWAFCGFCVPEAPKISKIIKYKQIVFRTVFSNGFNSLKTMLYVPIVTRQIGLSLAFQNRNFEYLKVPYSGLSHGSNREYTGFPDL